MELTALLAAALAVVLAAAVTAVRLVPPGHLAVVTRAGRPVRSRASGMLALLPGVERVCMVPVQRSEGVPFPVLAVTRDGVEVRLTVSVLRQVVDPVLVADGAHDPEAAVGLAVERALRQVVAGEDLAVLLRDRPGLQSRLRAEARPLVASFGVDVLHVDLLDMEVRVGPELLRMVA